jgi:hypothetical protein
MSTLDSTRLPVLFVSHGSNERQRREPGIEEGHDPHGDAGQTSHKDPPGA